MLIRTRVKAVYFNDRWQFSNGCTFEFAVACEHGLPTFNSRMHPISTRDAVTLVERAAAGLQSQGFETTRLERYVARESVNWRSRDKWPTRARTLSGAMAHRSRQTPPPYS